MESKYEPAYPIVNSEGFPTVDSALNVRNPGSWLSGLTKRERFAMAAMQGLLARPTSRVTHPDSVKSIINKAYEYADEALLKALE